MHNRYAVFPDPGRAQYIATEVEVSTFPLYAEAASLADELTEETGKAHVVFSLEYGTVPPPPEPLENVYELVPGRDFPATLNL